MMNEECLICRAPLEYLEADVLKECEICLNKKNVDKDHSTVGGYLIPHLLT